MNSRIPFLPIALLALFAANPAMAIEGECGGRGQANVGTVYFPHSNDVGLYPRSPNREEITIAGNGSLTLGGRRVEQRELRGDLASILSVRTTDVGIRPAAEAPLSAVLPVLELLNELNHCATGFIGNETHGEVFEDNTSEIEISHIPEFAGEFDAYVTIEGSIANHGGGVGNTPDRCRAYFMRSGVNSDQLRDSAFRRLSNIVSLHGGLEQTPRSSMNAIIEARGSTPWRCIAGAIYNVQISGFPTVDLVILPEGQPAVAETSSSATVDLFEVGYGPADANGEMAPRCQIYFDRRGAAFGDRLADAFAGSEVVVHGDAQPRMPDGEQALPGADGPTAAVMARPEAPWRCVAGAIYNIQLAGYVNVGFISTPED